MQFCLLGNKNSPSLTSSLINHMSMKHFKSSPPPPHFNARMETDLLGFVLRYLLVSLRLLCSVQGILLVELQHLHLLLDGIHGCLLSWWLTERRKLERRWRASAPNWTLTWSASSGSQAADKYVLWPYEFWRTPDTSPERHAHWLMPSLAPFFKELICNSLCRYLTVHMAKFGTHRPGHSLRPKTSCSYFLSIKTHTCLSWYPSEDFPLIWYNY